MSIIIRIIKKKSINKIETTQTDQIIQLLSLFFFSLTVCFTLQDVIVQFLFHTYLRQYNTDIFDFKIMLFIDES